MTESNTPRTALWEISDLITRVHYEDMAHKVAVSMSEIIVKGKPVGYVFTPDNELSGYWANDSENLWLDELTESLLQRSGLIEISKDTNGILIRPTNKAMELYERFREERRLDEEGYLDGQTSGFC